MTFLNPLLLIGLAAAAIPLIIHLFNFRRPRRIQFSSLAFLHELKKSTMQRVRIKQWLLLALRTLALAALAIAFARPTLEGAMAGFFGGTGNTSAALVIDHSPSMTLRDGSGAYLDQAKLVATELLADFESGDEWILVPLPLTQTGLVPYQSASAIRSSVDALEPQEGISHLTQSIQSAADALSETRNLNKVLYVLSDLQASTFTDSLRLDIPEGIRVVLLPVGTAGRGNLAVSGVQVLSQIVAEGQPVRLEVTFTNYGSDDVNGLVASVFIEDVRVGQATLDLAAGTSSTARFIVTPRQTGWLSGRVDIEDNQYLYDNTRRFTLLVPELRKILLVNGNRAPKSFIRLSLSNELATSEVQFETDEVAESALSGVSLGSYDSVILNGVPSLSTGEISSLSAYVRGGGGLLVFPSEDIRIDDYNAFFADLQAGRILPLPIASEEGITAGVFERVDTEHALFEGMFEIDSSGKAPQLEQPTIYRAAQYAPGSATEQTIIGMSGGFPFLQEIRAGQGSVLLYSVDTGTSWSDFPVRGLFLPLLYRSLYYLSATGSVTGEGMLVEGSLQLRLAGVDGSSTVLVRDEAGLEFIPEQRSVQGAKLVDLQGPFFFPGVYSLFVDAEMVRRIVVHPNPAESDLTLLDPEDASDFLTERIGSEVVALNLALSSGERLDEQIRSARVGVELWNVFLGLALTFLLLEMLVSKLWRPESVL